MNYRNADLQLTGRNKDRRKLANNTYLERRGKDIAIRLHNTDILTYSSDGTVTVDVGNWLTVTTKHRLNEYLEGYSIQQERGTWYVSKGQERVGVFHNGMQIDPLGRLVGAEPLGEARENSKLRRRVNQYSKDYVAALFNGDVPKPGAGDCFFCGLRTGNGNTMGEEFHDRSHILSHLDEKYYVPSLVARAMETGPVSQVMRWAIGEKWFPEQFPSNGHSFADKYTRDQIAKVLGRYILRQLGQVA